MADRFDIEKEFFLSEFVTFIFGGGNLVVVAEFFTFIFGGNLVAVAEVCEKPSLIPALSH